MTQLQTDHGTNRSHSRGYVQLALAGIGLLAGCSGGGSTPPGATLPAPPVTSNATAYIGTQAPGIWALSVDDTQKIFSYQQATGSLAAQSGGFAPTNGILDLGNLSGVALGKAVAQPAGGALLRPGGPATYPVAMIQQSDCFAVTGKLRYVYAAVLNAQYVHAKGGASEVGYGTFVVSTSADAKTWSFEDLHSFALTAAGYPAGTEDGEDPALFSATCSSANGVGTINANAGPIFPPDNHGNPSAPPAFHFDFGGAFVKDSSSTNWAGFLMPAAPVMPADVAAGAYRGFVFEGTFSAPMNTRPVAFTPAVTGSTSLSGGAFPKDDLTQTPGSEYTLTLGKQDSTLNGVFPNAQFLALDVNGYCAQVAPNDPNVTVGFDAVGRETCTASGVGVVSQVGGKYVLYFTSHDGTTEKDSGTSYVIQFYLYQQ